MNKVTHKRHAADTGLGSISQYRGGYVYINGQLVLQIFSRYKMVSASEKAWYIAPIMTAEAQVYHKKTSYGPFIVYPLNTDYKIIKEHAMKLAKGFM